MSLTIETSEKDLEQVSLLEDEEDWEENLQSEGDEDEEEMAGGEHGEISMLLGSYLTLHVHQNKLGRVFDGQTGFKIGGKPPKRRPDVAFVTLERMPERIREEIPFAPDLAVEIVSPTNPAYDVDVKIVQYLQAGVKLVWNVRPVLKLVEVFHPGDLKPTVLGINDEIDGEKLIPGFKLPVATLFE